MSDTAATSPEAPDAPKSPEAPKASNKRLIMIAAAVVVLLGGGGVTYWTLAGSAAESADAKALEPDAPPPAIVVPVDTFVVNLADPGGRTFLRVTLSLIVSDAHAAAELGESEVAKMRVRSAILELLALQTGQRLVTPDGKAELKSAIAESLGSAIANLHIADVLFSEFVVQF
jgi:flagellar FliL protein